MLNRQVGRRQALPTEILRLPAGAARNCQFSKTKSILDGGIRMLNPAAARFSRPRSLGRTWISSDGAFEDAVAGSVWRGPRTGREVGLRRCIETCFARSARGIHIWVPSAMPA